MKTQRQPHVPHVFSEERLVRASTALNSAIADAAAQGTLDEAISDRLARLAADAPRDDLDREVITARNERLSQAMSYFNELHSAQRLETDLVRMTFSFGMEDSSLVCAVIEATKRDIGLIEYRLEAAVEAGVLDDPKKQEILANPFLNQQADHALDAFSAIPPSKRASEP